MSNFWFYAGAAVLFCTILWFGVLPPDRTRDARDLVGAALLRNPEAKIRPAELAGRRNDNGDGIYVYVDRQAPMPRALWIVLDGRAYAMNGTARGQTPGLAFIGDAFAVQELKRRGVQDAVDLLPILYGS